MMGPIYDELFYMDVDETRYYLAESYEISEDGLNVTVKLKDGLTWHDGQPITADDFIFTLECIWIPTMAQGLPMWPLSTTSR